MERLTKQDVNKTCPTEVNSIVDLFVTCVTSMLLDYDCEESLDFGVSSVGKCCSSLMLKKHIYTRSNIATVSRGSF